MKINLLESFFLQIVIYLTIWLCSEYVGSLICIIVPIICLSVLFITFLVELIEKSNVPRIYYAHMLVLAFTPALVGIAIVLTYGGNLDWLQEIK